MSLGIVFGDEGSATVDKMRVRDVECPSCHETFDYVSGPMRGDKHGWRHLASALRPDGVTREDYLNLAEEVRQLREAGAAPEQVAERLASTIFTDLAGIALSQKSATLASWLQVVLTVIFWLTGGTQDPAPQAPPPAPQVNVQVVNPSVGELEQQLQRIADELGVQIAEEPAMPSVPQNAPCPCASGRKFKLCHGSKRWPDRR